MKLGQGGTRGLQAFGRLREILREEGARFLEEGTRREGKPKRINSEECPTLRFPDLCYNWSSWV